MTRVRIPPRDALLMAGLTSGRPTRGQGVVMHPMAVPANRAQRRFLAHKLRRQQKGKLS
jgi:hypothetical protein